MKPISLLREFTCQWDHTVLPATRQRRPPRHNPNWRWYSIHLPVKDERLSWPEKNYNTLKTGWNVLKSNLNMKPLNSYRHLQYNNKCIFTKGTMITSIIHKMMKSIVIVKLKLTRYSLLKKTSVGHIIWAAHHVRHAIFGTFWSHQSLASCPITRLSGGDQC